MHTRSRNLSAWRRCNRASLAQIVDVMFLVVHRPLPICWGTFLFLLSLRSARRWAVLMLTSTGQPRTPQPTRAPLGAAVRWLQELEPEQALEKRQKYCPRLTQIFPIPPNPSSALNQNRNVEMKIEQLCAMILVPILHLCA